ncbi:MAG TPA: DUF5723 family protein [Bacteroidales bacterium]|nr:DUF5723 family protein [Bacteroidales bacterium]
MKKIYTIIVFFVLCLIQSSFSQNDLTIYYLQSIPQSTYSNPALIPECKVHIGIPVMSSLYTSFSNGGFNIKDIFYNRSDDSVGINIDRVINKLGKKNFLTFKTQIELVSFGFKAKQNYFNYSMSEKILFRFGYPRDLISLIWNGNSQFINKKADFKGLGINAIHYTEFALGYARTINDKLTIGGKGKFLIGHANIWTKGNSKMNLSVADSSYDITVNSYFTINTSVPPQWFENKDFDIKNYFTNFNNKGLALDLGIQYKFNDKFTLSASAIDLGYIHWTKDVKNYSHLDQTNSFIFKGINLNDFLNKSDSAFDAEIDNLLDSLSNSFNVSETKNSYNYPLNSIVNIGFSYNLSPYDKIGILLHGEFYTRSVHPAIALSYNRQLGQMLRITTTYSINNRS